MTFYYKTYSFSNNSTEGISEETKNTWEFFADKKNWRIVQLPNGFYQTEYKDIALVTIFNSREINRHCLSHAINLNLIALKCIKTVDINVLFKLLYGHSNERFNNR